jgi:hypothetical protein
MNFFYYRHAYPELSYSDRLLVMSLDAQKWLREGLPFELL